jgi:hypothetical protein
MIEDKIKYSTAFTTGALLARETEVLISFIINIEDFLQKKETVDYTLIPVNSEKSKKNLKSEIEKRLRALNNPTLIDRFTTANNTTKRVILFYAICKTYPVIKHFMLEVVLNKWQNLDTDLSVSDFTNFLYRKMDYHPELEKITEKSIYKCGQVVIKMLIDLGMVIKNKLQKIDVDTTILKECNQVGDNWFMDVVLLNDLQKQEI